MNELEKRRRGRPRKSADQKKVVDLRIPVTQEQKAIITAAARVVGEDMAAWVRPILLNAAAELLSKNNMVN